MLSQEDVRDLILSLRATAAAMADAARATEQAAATRWYTIDEVAQMIRQPATVTKKLLEELHCPVLQPSEDRARPVVAHRDYLLFEHRLRERALRTTARVAARNAERDARVTEKRIASMQGKSSE
jgi:hypothetical protein